MYPAGVGRLVAVEDPGRVVRQMADDVELLVTLHQAGDHVALADRAEGLAACAAGLGAGGLEISCEFLAHAARHDDHVHMERALAAVRRWLDRLTAHVLVR